jgi:hypothetical protein
MSGSVFPMSVKKRMYPPSDSLAFIEIEEQHLEPQTPFRIKVSD